MASNLLAYVLEVLSPSQPYGGMGMRDIISILIGARAETRQHNHGQLRIYYLCSHVTYKDSRVTICPKGGGHYHQMLSGELLQQMTAQVDFMNKDKQGLPEVPDTLAPSDVAFSVRSRRNR